MSDTSSTLRLILWPSVITLAVSIARLVGEVQGWITDQSGGAMHPLGITWLALLFGGWFGWRHARAGALPRVRRAWLWALVALLAMVGTMAWRMQPLLQAERSEATFAQVRVGVLTIIAVAVVGAGTMFFVWAKQAFTLLLYGLVARATVVAITWFVKLQGWHLHYVKFGPPGIEPDTMQETLVSASIAQFGMWVPFTILAGTLVGGLFARRQSTSSQAS